MRLVSFMHQGALRWGRLEGDAVADSSGAAAPHRTRARPNEKMFAG